jgi:hypothetical protein
MSHKRVRFLAWGLLGITIAGTSVRLVDQLKHINGSSRFYDLVEAFGWSLTLPLVFAILGALIILRQHNNRVGWMLMFIGLVAAEPTPLLLERYASPPEVMSPGLWLLLWFNSWSWLPLIFSFLMIPLYFPTGHPPSPRWRWVSRAALVMALFFIGAAAFTTPMTFGNQGWQMTNPIGLIDESTIEGPFLIVWGILMVGLAGSSAASLYVRYRRSDGGERQQIKWLLYAAGLFVIVFSVGFILSNSIDPGSNGWFDLIFVLAILATPIAIAIAIFRYRLWDLDVVVNRALVYGPLTTILAGVFAILIAVTTVLSKQLFGDQSKVLGAAISAVAVAVIFQPLRDRIQAWVDKRFYPRKATLEAGLVEVQPEYWAFLDHETLVGISQDYVCRAMGVSHTAFYLAAPHDEFRLDPGSEESDGRPGTLKLNPKQLEELQKKRVVASNGSGLAAGHVPIYVDRGQSIQLLGLLSIGKRSNGKGFSGDDLKGLVELGGKVGLALNAIQLSERRGKSAVPSSTITDAKTSSTIRTN